MSTQQREKFKDSQEVDLAYSVPGLGRFRCNVFQQRGTVGLVLRVIPMQIRTIDELGLPKVLKTIAEEERGLVLVTGTTGSGKSTTLAAMIDHVNNTREAHVMTVEDPIEFLHRDAKVDHQPARGRGRHQVVRPCPAQRAAAGSRRDSRRRNARLRNDRDGPARGRNRPSRVLHAAHGRRHRNDQPYRLRVRAASAEAGPPAARQRAQGGHLAAPHAAEGRQGPRAGGRSHGQHALHPRLHRRQGKDPSRFTAPSPRARRSTGCRSFDQSIFSLFSQGLVSYEEALRWASNVDEFKLRVQGISTTADISRDQMASTTLGHSANHAVRIVDLRLQALEASSSMRPSNPEPAKASEPSAYIDGLKMLGRRELSEAQVRQRLAAQGARPGRR